MGLQKISAILILSSLMPEVLAVSLGELGLAAPTSSEPTACNKAYRSSIRNCSLTDFDNGCSVLCTAGVTKTWDALTLECSPGYVTTILGSSLASAGVKLLCPSPLLGKGSAESKSARGSAQATSAGSEATSAQTTATPTSETSRSVERSSSTTPEPATTESPTVSKGSPPNIVITLLPASSANSTLATYTLTEPGSTASKTTLSTSLVTSNSLTRAPNSIPTRESSAIAKTLTILPTLSSNGTAALPAGGKGQDGMTKSKNSSAGPIVGGILGGVAIIALLIILAFYFLVRPQRQRQAEEDEVYNQKTAPLDTNTLTREVTSSDGPRWSAANPYPAQPPTLVTKPYRSNSNRSAVSALVRNDSRVSMRSINCSNSMSDRYDVSPVDRYGNAMFDPYSTSAPFDRYGPYGSPPMDDRYGPYSTSPMSINRYDTSPVAPISFMEAEWNHLRGQQPMRQNSNPRRPMFNNYPSVIEEERESNVTSSVQGSIYELPVDGSSSKISVRKSEDNKRGSVRRSEDTKRTGTPEIPRRSPLRVVNGSPEI